MARQDFRRGGIISRLLFTGMVVFLLLLVAGVIVTRTVRVHSNDGSNGADVAIDTPAGRLKIRARENMGSSGSGIPVYPGAYRVRDSGGANFEWNSKDGNSDRIVSLVGAELRTKDPASRVVAYYRKQLPSVMVVNEKDQSARIEFMDGSIRRILAISENDGETHIDIAAIGGRESN